MGIAGSTTDEKKNKSPTSGNPTGEDIADAAPSISIQRKLLPYTADSVALIGSPPIFHSHVLSIEADISEEAGHDTSNVSRPSIQLQPYSPYVQNNTQAYVFSWKYGGRDVYLTGSFNNWKTRIPMQESNGDFTCIQNLPPGKYLYKFIVDGQWKTDPSQPIFTDFNGEPSNVLELTEMSISFLKNVISSSPPGEYGYNEQLPIVEKSNVEDSHSSSSSSAATATVTTTTTTTTTTKTVPIGPGNLHTPFASTVPARPSSPPSLPPHLLRALLNTTPPDLRDPTLLPLPHHVMLNHLYSMKRQEDGTMIIGITQRYHSKFITTVYYKPLQEANQ